MILISFDNNETLEVSNPESAKAHIDYRNSIFGIKAVKVVAVDYDNQRAVSDYANMLNNNAIKPKEV
tara:strand:+ start:761 stop:961 length:201 start_codon:yes stop_codon:yes gene_type:complete